MIKKILPFCLVVVFISTMCSAADDILIIPGTGDSQKLLRRLAEEYEKSHPGIHVEIPDSIGSGGGIRAVAAGKAEMARVARGIKKREERFNLRYAMFAKSPVVFATHPSVKEIDNVTAAQVVGIYTGEITNWKSLGGPDRKIYPIHREAGDSSRKILFTNIPGFEDIAAPAGKTIYSTPEAVEALMKYEDTFGYVPLMMVKNGLLNILQYEKTDPTGPKGSADYPLVTPFGIVWRDKLSKKAEQFKQYLFSKDAARIIREAGGIPVSGAGK